ncbi:MAG: YbaN family protein [Candidatus Krumholzibacteria bacterium]|jgi:uncharacterized membrane protein YbaN (DUF454 family)|nr:YbaN family protein [Candidatus Krumholzibacteria bacterium]
MTTYRTSTAITAAPVVATSRLRRWLLAALGLCCVGLAAIGAVLPGLPTTVFLIAAAWCFTRSCPWLERKFVQAPLFKPFQPYLQPGALMPRRARVAALIAMWTAIAVSVLAMRSSGGDWIWALRGAVVLAGVAGTVAILRYNRTD